MSSRERWTIYPLLFLTLGIALRDKVAPTANFKSLQCEDLTVVNRNAARLLSIGGTRLGTSRLEVYGRKEKIVASLGATRDGGSAELTISTAEGAPRVKIKSSGRGGAVETYAAAGAPQVLLRSSARGGVVTAIDNAGQRVITLGHESNESGVFAVDVPERRTATVLFIVPPAEHESSPKQRASKEQTARPPGEKVPEKKLPEKKAPDEKSPREKDPESPASNRQAPGQ